MFVSITNIYKLKINNFFQESKYFGVVKSNLFRDMSVNCINSLLLIKQLFLTERMIKVGNFKGILIAVLKHIKLI